MVYEIYTNDDFFNYLNANGGNVQDIFLLRNDLDMTGETRTVSTTFSAYFNGQNNTISNYIGSYLFLNISGTVENIEFIFCTIEAGTSGYAGLFANAGFSATIRNIKGSFNVLFNNGTILSNIGFVGVSDGSLTILNCNIEYKFLNSNSYITFGGLLGYMDQSREAFDFENNIIFFNNSENSNYAGIFGGIVGYSLFGNTSGGLFIIEENKIYGHINVGDNSLSQKTFGGVFGYVDDLSIGTINLLNNILDLDINVLTAGDDYSAGCIGRVISTDTVINATDCVFNIRNIGLNKLGYNLFYSAVALPNLTTTNVKYSELLLYTNLDVSTAAVLTDAELKDIANFPDFSTSLWGINTDTTYIDLLQFSPEVVAAFNLFIKKYGQWKQVDSLFIRKFGQWKSVDSLFIRKFGQWKQ